MQLHYRGQFRMHGASCATVCSKSCGMIQLNFQTAECRGTGVQYEAICLRLCNLPRASNSIRYYHMLYQMLVSICSMEHNAWRVIATAAWLVLSCSFCDDFQASSTYAFRSCLGREGMTHGPGHMCQIQIGHLMRHSDGLRREGLKEGLVKVPQLGKGPGNIGKILHIC